MQNLNGQSALREGQSDLPVVSEDRGKFCPFASQFSDGHCGVDRVSVWLGAEASRVRYSVEDHQLELCRWINVKFKSSQLF